MNKNKNGEFEGASSSCCAPSREPGCDSSQTPCCDCTEVQHSEKYLSPGSTIGENKGVKIEQKLKIDIYVPLEACSCEWSQFMNLIFSVITPYIKYIKHETKSLNSEEARNLNLTGKCVIVDGEKKYTTSYELKKDLPLILRQKGLL